MCWAHGRTWGYSWQAGSREDLRTQPRGLQSIETGKLKFLSLLQLKGRKGLSSPHSSLCSLS